MSFPEGACVGAARLAAGCREHHPGNMDDHTQLTPSGFDGSWRSPGGQPGPEENHMTPFEMGYTADGLVYLREAA